MAAAGNSTVSELLAAKPCVQCFKGNELLAVAIVLMAEHGGYTMPDDVGTLMSASACDGCGVSETQMLEALVSALWTHEAADETAAELKAKAKCLACTPGKLRQILTYLLIGHIEGLTDGVPT